MTIQTAFEDVDSLYIADGHHRTAAAHRLAQSETDPTKKSYWQSRFLVGLLFPHSQLRVLSFGRCLRSLGTLTTDKFLRQVAKSFIIKLRTDLIEPGSPTSVSSGSLSDSTSCESSSSLSPTVSVSTDYLFSESHDSILSFPSENVSSENQLSSLTFKPLLPVFNLNMHLEKNAIKYEPYHSRNINMYIDGRWFELTPKQMPRSHAGPLDELGVQILIDKLLDPILGPEDHDADSRMEYICGDRSDGRALAQMVDCGDVSVAFCVCRIEIADIMKVADAGQLLPPKATCFDPKPCSGLFLRLS